jgi:hypothetical protein
VHELVAWLSSNAAALSISGAAIAFIVSTALQVFQRRAEAAEKQFQAYHELLERLVSRGRDGMYVDRQAAIVFELRHFPRYYDFTERMLVRLKHDWTTDPKTSANPLTLVMIEEIDLTLKHIQHN